MPRPSLNDYPPDWKATATEVKRRADWRCIRCGHPHDPATGHTLTVHHADLDKANCAWWNLLALCQRCHLSIQARVIMERPWMLEHSAWFKPYVAGYYAHYFRFPEERAYVEAHIEELIAFGQGVRAEVDA